TDALRDTHDVRFDIVMLARKHLPGATHSRLHFIDDQQNSMLIADPPQSLEKTFRRRDVTTFTLHRFNHDGRDFLRRRSRFEESFFDPIQRALCSAAVTAIRSAEWIPKLVRIRHVNNVERLALETFSLCRFR